MFRFEGSRSKRPGLKNAPDSPVKPGQEMDAGFVFGHCVKKRLISCPEVTPFRPSKGKIRCVVNIRSPVRFREGARTVQ